MQLPHSSSDSECSRQALIDSVARRDAAKFERLCTDHEEWIFSNFQSWLRCPEEIRGNEPAMIRYGNAMEAVANFFAARGRGELRQMMTRTDDQNAVVRWSNQLLEGMQMIERGNNDGAAEIALEIIAHASRCVGPGKDASLAKGWALLGVARFRSHDLDGAEKATARAIEICQAAGDEEGVAAYCGSMAEIERVRGDRNGYVS